MWLFYPNCFPLFIADAQSTAFLKEQTSFEGEARSKGLEAVTGQGGGMADPVVLPTVTQLLGTAAFSLTPAPLSLCLISLPCAWFILFPVSHSSFSAVSPLFLPQLLSTKASWPLGP